MTTPRILVIGAVNLDVIIEVPRLPREGETLVGGRLTQAPGGKGANQAVAVARLGGHAAFCGRVGNDDWGRMVSGRLAQSGVSTAGLLVDRERATGAAMVLVEPGGKNQIIAVGGANLGVSPQDVDRSLTAGRLDAVMLTLETPRATIEYAIRRAVELNIPVILDAAPPADYPLHVFRGVTVLSPNETEAHALTSIAIDSLDDARQAARVLREGSGARRVVMKLGERGALILDDDGDRWIEPVKVQAIDTTAAGDAFTAALTMSLCRQATIDEAVRYANIAGAITTTRAGAQNSLPTAAEIAGLQRV